MRALGLGYVKLQLNSCYRHIRKYRMKILCVGYGKKASK